MCGIVGYIGKNEAKPILLEGIKRLEYRGYDSAGMALVDDGKLSLIKSMGKISVLRKKMEKKEKELSGKVGIIHTRWATHGKPSTKNAHPHLDCSKRIALVHNGIIENYSYLKEKLKKEGHKFKSETDTEILTHLIEKYSEGDLARATQKALKEVRGAFGICVISADDPDTLIAARRGSPIIIGLGDDEYIVASDVAAIIAHTKQIIYLEDNEMAVIKRGGLKTTTLDDVSISKEIKEVSWQVEMIEKSGFDTFMAKEIHEQPISIHEAMAGRFEEDQGKAHLGGLYPALEKLSRVKKLSIVACGTSLYAGMVAEYMIEELARLPIEVEFASEFRYRNPILDEKTAVLIISQSGETADTIAALREAKLKGALTVGICNVVGSTISRETDVGVYLRAGPEIGVASTKAFTSQLTVLFLMAILLGRQRSLSLFEGKELISALKKVPSQIKEILTAESKIREVAKKYATANNFLYLGRGYSYPVALEGALKLKEISYIHAEGYPAAEMKHGPIALVTENMPVVFCIPKDRFYEKTLSNIEEVKARSGKIIAIATKGDRHIAKMADDCLYVPATMEPLTPLLTVVPLQLLAYHIALMRSCDVDQPRNLAKSVTVE